MGRLTPFDWPQQAVRLDGDGLALALLTLPAGTARPAARQLARDALRQILGGLLARPAGAIVLREGEGGQYGPLLDDAARNIRISLSYANDRCLIGLAEGRALGVDIVHIEKLPERTALSRLYLSAAACRHVLAAPHAEQDACFAQHWAQMEARSKCLGLPLAEIDPQRELALQACPLIACTQPPAYRISLATLPLSSEHVATLI